MGWTDVFVGDEAERRKRRKKKIDKLKKRKTKSSKQKMIDKKDVGWKAVETQRKKKRMLKEAGK